MICVSASATMVRRERAAVRCGRRRGAGRPTARPRRPTACDRPIVTRDLTPFRARVASAPSRVVIMGLRGREYVETRRTRATSKTRARPPDRCPHTRAMGTRRARARRDARDATRASTSMSTSTSPAPAPASWRAVVATRTARRARRDDEATRATDAPVVWREYARDDARATASEDARKSIARRSARAADEDEDADEDADETTRRAEDEDERETRAAYTRAYVDALRAPSWVRDMGNRARGEHRIDERAWDAEGAEDEEEDEEDETTTSSENEEEDEEEEDAPSKAATKTVVGVSASARVCVHAEDEPKSGERGVVVDPRRANRVAAAAVAAPAARSAAAISAKWVAALAVGATAVVAPFVMRTSGLNSLAPGSSNGVQFRDFGLSSARRWMYDGDRSLLESSSDFETLQRRLAEMEQRLRDANEEIDRAREDAKAAAKMRRKLDEARTEASEANAREAAAVADRDAVWKALRGQLADAAKARAAIETESLAIATDLEQAKIALDAALTSQSSCGGAVDEDLRAALDDAEANKRTLQEKVDNLSNTVDCLNRQLSELSASKSAELDAAEERDRLREETRRVTETLASKEQRLGELERRLSTSEIDLDVLSKELIDRETKLRDALARAEEMESASSLGEDEFARKLAVLQKELETSKRRAEDAAAASDEAKNARDAALDELRKAQIEAQSEADKFERARQASLRETSAKVTQLENEHGKLLTQLNRAEAALSEYIVVSTAHVSAVVSEQKMAFDGETKALQSQLEGNSTLATQLEQTLKLTREEHELTKVALETMEQDMLESQEQCMKEVVRTATELSESNAALTQAREALDALELEMSEYKNRTTTLDVDISNAVDTGDEIDVDALVTARDELKQALDAAREERQKLLTRLAFAEEERAFRRNESIKFQEAATEAGRLRNEAESRRLALEDELERVKAEVKEAEQSRAEAESARKRAEEQRVLALRAVEEERKMAEIAVAEAREAVNSNQQALKAQIEAEAVAAQRAEEEEAARLRAEAEAAERARVAEAEEALARAKERELEEAERLRIAAVESARLRAEAEEAERARLEATRLEAEAEERRRVAAEEEQRQRLIAAAEQEQRRVAAAAAAKREEEAALAAASRAEALRERERAQAEMVKAKQAQAEKRVQKLLKAAKKAYRLAEDAHARAKTLQDAVSSVPLVEREDALARAKIAADEAAAAQEKWDKTYALAKEAMRSLE